MDENNLAGEDAAGPRREMQLTEYIIHELYETRKWTYLIARISFVVMALMIILAVGLLFGQANRGKVERIFAVVPLVAILGIYLIPIWYLYQFSVYSKHAVEENDNAALGFAMNYLKKHYRFWP